MRRTRTILGLAFDDARLSVAEVRCAARPRLLGSGVFGWPTAGALDHPEDTGAALRAFLQERRIVAKEAVVGLPAHWLISRTLDLPAVRDEALPGVLRLQAERAFSLDAQDLVVDAVGPVPRAHGGLEVLLVATPRRRLEQVRALLQAAGIESLAVTATGLSLRRLDREGHRGLVVTDAGLETWPVREGLPQLHFHEAPELGAADGRDLRAPIRRLLLLSAGRTNGEPLGISLYTPNPLDEEAFLSLSRSLNGQAVLLNGDRWLEQAGFGSDVLAAAGPARLAAALPLTPSRDAGLELDFLRSTLTRTPRRSHGRGLTWGLIGAAVLVALIALASWDAHRTLRDIRRIEGQLAAQADALNAARALNTRLTYAVRWTSREPEFLGYLKQLTETFPETGSIWVTNLAIAENRKAVITGQAVDERPVLEVLDALRRRPEVADVTTLYLRDAGRNTNEVSFALSFRFTGGT